MNNRRQAIKSMALASMAIASLPAMATGLAQQLGSLLSGPKARLWVVLVDTTQSVSSEDWQLYEAAMAALLKDAKPGDRIVLGQVHDRPGSRFIAHADHRFEASGNSMHDKVRMQRRAKDVQADFARLRSNGNQPARATLLGDAIGASVDWFAQARVSQMSLNLLLLSDMIEEGPTLNFARNPVTPALAERVIAQQRSRQLLPDLTGVMVHVVGASGRDAEHMAQIRGFWQAYFTAAGAVLQSYGRNARALAA